MRKHALSRTFLIIHFTTIAHTPSHTPTMQIHACSGTENDYQLDIADAGNRTTYKRIVDRAAAFGITHLLFAPRNSDVSCQRNNTDAWGWEQILWFGTPFGYNFDFRVLR